MCKGEAGKRSGKQIMGVIAAGSDGTSLFLYVMGDGEVGNASVQQPARLLKEIKITSRTDIEFCVGFSGVQSGSASKYVAVGAGRQLYVYDVLTFDLNSSVPGADCTAYLEYPVRAVSFNSLSKGQEGSLAVVTESTDAEGESHGVLQIYGSQDGAVIHTFPEGDSAAPVAEMSSCVFLKQESTSASDTVVALLPREANFVQLEKMHLSVDRNLLKRLKMGKDKASTVDYSSAVNTCVFPPVQRCAENCNLSGCDHCGIVPKPWLAVSTEETVVLHLQLLERTRD